MSTVETPMWLRATSADEDLSPDAFKAVFRDHPAGVAVVTAQGGDGPVAMTVSSLFSVSAVPPLLAFSASALSSGTPGILGAEFLMIHMVDEASLPLAQVCATSGADRFSGELPWARLATGEPYFLQPAVRIRGQVVRCVDAGSSTIVIVRALEVISNAVPTAASRPVVYHDRSWHVLSDDSRVGESPRKGTAGRVAAGGASEAGKGSAGDC
ncbi:MAG: flavin reductase family protein [Microbacterium sp.]|uniref:flavin reductase family protein n=1 Tax=Microbacterium sp. TaxID=51671 RepID=UPI003F812DBC